MESMNVQYWYAECWRPLVLVVVGDVDPHQDTGAPYLLTLTGWKLDHQPSLSPGLQVQLVQTKFRGRYTNEIRLGLYLIFAERMK